MVNLMQIGAGNIYSRDVAMQRLYITINFGFNHVQIQQHRKRYTSQEVFNSKPYLGYISVDRTQIISRVNSNYNTDPLR
ncbi:hypothetical protein NIES3974_00520 [Calothrix sp. NIES-3974]|nr:hypothetical protein NIES3974_00520 [Calothrix sp. NIES-3974]